METPLQIVSHPCIYEGAMSNAPEFQHEYISLSLRASRYGLCSVFHCSILRNIHKNYTDVSCKYGLLSKSSIEVDCLSFLFIDLYAPALTPGFYGKDAALHFA
jgi:hypothetical protein